MSTINQAKAFAFFTLTLFYVEYLTLNFIYYANLISDNLELFLDFYKLFYLTAIRILRILRFIDVFNLIPNNYLIIARPESTDLKKILKNTNKKIGPDLINQKHFGNKHLY